MLDAEIVNGAGAIDDILIGGHSVGGGLGMLLSTRIQVGGLPGVPFLWFSEA